MSMTDRLLAWYRVSRRILPWREDPSPYHVWISEIMLQQTRVEAVKGYYERFLGALPDIESLAGCPEDRLLKLWEGLGYYNRVRNLQKAAVVLLEEYGGEMPSTRDELCKLPGIGSYTSAAIASICFGEPVPAVDGNLLRVWTRVQADPACISEESVKRRIEGELSRVIPKDAPGIFNQAMMDLGATICLPTGTPGCAACPWQKDCKAHALGRENEFPVKAAQRARIVEEKTILVIRDGDRVALHKRPAKGLLAGLYEFPSLEGFQSSRQVQHYLDTQGLKVLRILPLEDARHIFTHKEWHMKGFLVQVDELERHPISGEGAQWIYARPEETQAGYPIPSAFEAYAAALEIRLGKEGFMEEQGGADA